MPTATATISYHKTKTGKWVVVGPVSSVLPGSAVTVTKRDGTTKTETVLSVGRPFTAADGVEKVYGYLAERTTSAHAGPSGCTCSLHRQYRACRTGGNCSSVGSGRNCGGCDCDGF